MDPKKQKGCNDNGAISIDSVSKAFAARLVLNDINLSVARGQSVCMCGANGVGKSTLLRIIAGLLQPDRGSVLLNGYNVSRDPEKAKPLMGVISHKSMVYPNLTVLENLFFLSLLASRNSLETSDLCRTGMTGPVSFRGDCSNAWL
jgi:ABC-type multidrug transport system ATPase subunit